MSSSESPGNVVHKSGLTVRSLLGIFYAAIIMQPAILWIYLSTGSVIGILAAYASIFLFSEFASWSGKGLTKQEIFVFLIGCSVASGSLLFPIQIYNLYFRRHPLTVSYGISKLLPDWFTPFTSSNAWGLRTLVHPDFLFPILIGLFVAFSMTISNTALGFLMREVYIVQEKLPFPLQQVDAEICTTLAEKRRDRLSSFILSALIGAAYAIIIYAIPSISYAALDVRIRLVPLPWLDLNFLVENVFPGASFGITTEPLIIVLGLILPPFVTIGIFIGSMAVYFFGNWILVISGLFTEWTPGMNLQNTWQRSILHFWAGPNIILAIAAGVLPLLFHPRPLIDSIKSLLRLKRGVGGGVSLKLILAMYFSATISSVLLSHFLIPDFPIWILLLLSVGWTFLLNLIVARSIGITGISLNIPYVREGAILSSGYAGYDVWFAPIVFPEVMPGGAWTCAVFKTADLVSAHVMDVVKVLIIAVPLGILFNFVYTQMFWSVAAVPSSFFPAPFWDISVTMTNLFINQQITLFRPEWILPTLFIATVLHTLIELLHLPLSLIGIVAGTTSPISNSVGILIGLLIGRILQRVFGKAWLNKRKTAIVAGVLTGEGLIVTLTTAIAMILKSFWVRAL